MIAKVFSGSVLGLDGYLVEVEASSSSGLPATIIVGLPDTAVQESKERVRAAIKASNFPYPQGRVSVNLAPADIPKIGSQYDVPIALSILLANGNVEFETQNKLFLGELSLDGRIRKVNGVLPQLIAAEKRGFKEFFIPEENLAEASLVKGVKIFTPKNLKDLLSHLIGLESLLENKIEKEEATKEVIEIDFKDISGQQIAKRALEIAASGGHNVLFSGSPGSGKTMLAKAFVGILPKLTQEEKLELTKIYSVSGRLEDKSLNHRPIRNPHHTASSVSLVGGGATPTPGEITLAHRGVLFLDEFPEFNRSVLEVLRQPLEEGKVTISRAKGALTFPAKFILLAAQNPCPCGFYGDAEKQCTCLVGARERYRQKISGPLLDRIDMHISVPRQTYSELKNTVGAETSKQVRERVERAREIQYKRFGKTKTNSEMSVKDIAKFCQLDDTSDSLLKNASLQHGFSGRTIHRVCKLARTIADLDGSENILANHIAEALQLRVNE